MGKALVRRRERAVPDPAAQRAETVVVELGSSPSTSTLMNPKKLTFSECIGKMRARASSSMRPSTRSALTASP